MIQKSKRVLLRNLGYAFCQKNKDEGQNTNSGEPTSSKKTNKKQKKHKQNQHTPKNHTNKSETVEPAKDIHFGINWAEIKFNDKSPNITAHRSYFEPQKFKKIIEGNALLSEIEKCIAFDYGQQSMKIFQDYLEHYILTQPHEAYIFITTKIINHKSTNSEFLQASNRVYLHMISSLIQYSQRSKLIEFLDILKNNINQKGGSLDLSDPSHFVTNFEVLCQIPYIAQAYYQKYEILNLYLQIIRSTPKIQQGRQRIIESIKYVFHEFTDRAEQNLLKEKDIQQFQQFFRNCISSKLFHKSLISQPYFYSILRLCYFCSCDNDNKKYSNFFSVIEKISASISVVDDYLQKFYQNLVKQINKSRLEHTDCESVALPVNKKFLENYKKGFKTENKEIVIACLAIAFDNNYLDIPEHFLQYFLQNFKKSQIDDLINEINHQLSLRKLILMQQNEDSSIKQSKHYQKFQNQVKDRLKSAIITKNYQKAWQLFDTNFFDQAKLQKQRQKIKYVLNHYIEAEKFTIKMGERSKSSLITEYVETRIGQEYLRQSWKKSEDVGQLLESYYIDHKANQQQVAEEQDENNQSHDNSAARFSYWDDYFLNKRAIQLHKFQVLEQINNMRDSEPQPVMPYHFNINQYYNSNLREQLWARGVQETEKIDQLKLHLYRIELMVEEIERLGLEKVVETLKRYEVELSEETVSKLQEFGIYDYDISLYDTDELLNRIKTYRRYRGIIRDPETLVSPFQTSEHHFRYENAFLDSFNPEDNGEYPQQYAENQEAEDGQQEVGQDQQEAAQVEEAEQQAVEAGQKQAVEAGQQDNEEFIEELPEDLVSGGHENQEYQYNEQQNNETEENIYVEHPTKTKIKDIIYDKRGFYRLSTELVDLIRIRNRKLFFEAEYLTKVPTYYEIVDQLIEWGLIYKQPMSIYLGEKLAMTSGQKIPHHLAIRVSDFFSHYRDIDENRINDCKKCLEVVGPIKRQIIYDSNKKYQHMIQKKFFKKQYTQLVPELQERLQDLFATHSSLYEKGSQERERRRKLEKAQPLSI